MCANQLQTPWNAARQLDHYPGDGGGTLLWGTCRQPLICGSWAQDYFNNWYCQFMVNNGPERCFTFSCSSVGCGCCGSCDEHCALQANCGSGCTYNYYYCYSCDLGGWNGNSCPKSPTSTFGDSTTSPGCVNVDCRNKISCLNPGTVTHSNVHNQYDTAQKFVGGWQYMLTNNELRCHVVCALSGNCGGQCGIDQGTGVVWYKTNLPMDYTVSMTCDNGFQQCGSTAFRFLVYCHETSTVVSQNAGLVQNQTWQIRNTITSTVNDIPYHYYPSFATSQSVCNLNSWQLFNDTQQTALDSRLVNAFPWYSPYYRMYVQNQYAQQKGYYVFFVKVGATGGAYFWTIIHTLTVYCGPSSTTITEQPSFSGNSFKFDNVPTYYDRFYQLYHVGWDNGFRFPEFQSSTIDCPILKYEVTIETVSTTLDARFPLASNINTTQIVWPLTPTYTSPTYQGTQSDTYKFLRANVLDNKQEAVYRFNIRAIAEGGQTYWTGSSPYGTQVRIVEFKCLQVFVLSTPATFVSNLGNIQASYTPYNMTFAQFVSPDPNCPVINYKIDNDNIFTTIVASPQVLYKDHWCYAAYKDLCRTYALDLQTLGTFTFWVVTTAQGGVQRTDSITYTVVCGFENITVSPTNGSRLYSRRVRDNANNIDNWWQEDFWRVGDYFQVDNNNRDSALCPIVKYEAVSCYGCSTATDSNIRLVNGLTPSLTVQQVNATQAVYQKYFYIKATTKGGKTTWYTFNYTICGFETQLNTTNRTQAYWYWPLNPDPNDGINSSYIASLYRFIVGPRSYEWCYEETLTFWHDWDCTFQFVNPKVPFVTIEKDDTFERLQWIHVWRTIPFPQTSLYLKRETRGLVRAIVKFTFEICGTETVALDPFSVPLVLNYTQFSGHDLRDYTHALPMMEYKNNFTTNSTLCLARNFTLVKLLSNGSYQQVTSGMVVMDPYNFDILVKTYLNYSMSLYILPVGPANKVYYEINVNVTSPVKNVTNLDILNKPPYFMTSIQNMYVNATPSNFSYVFKLTLPQVVDDFDEWTTMELNTKFFGNITFNNYTNKTNSSMADQVLGYESAQNVISFTFQSYQHYVQNLGEFNMRIKLRDNRGAFSTFFPNVTFVTSGVPQPPIVYLSYASAVTAYISDIDKSGLTTIQFSEPMHTDFNLKDINNSTLDVSVDFSEEWLNQDRNNTHALTWQILSFQNRTMKMQVNFTNPDWISKQNDRKDRLIVKFRNVVEDINRDDISSGNIRVSNAENRKEIPVADKFYDIITYHYDPNYGRYRGLQQRPEGYFIHTLTNGYFRRENCTTSYPIPTLFQGEWSLIATKQYAETNKDLIKATLIISYLCTVAGLGRGFNFMLRTTTNLQLAVHLPMMNFVFPENVMVYLHSMIPVAMYDILETSPGFKQIFKSLEKGTDSVNLKQQVKDLYYEQHNPYQNLGTFALFIFVWLFQVVILWCVMYPVLKHNLGPQAVKTPQSYEGGLDIEHKSESKDSAKPTQEIGVNDENKFEYSEYFKTKAVPPKKMSFEFGWKLKKERPKNFSCKGFCLKTNLERFHRWRRDLFWSKFIQLFLVGHLECLISGVLFWAAPRGSADFTGWFGTTSVSLLVITCVLLPTLFIYYASKDIRKFKERHFIIRWSALSSDVRLQNKPQMFYYLWFVLRRMIYVLLCYLVFDPHPVLQLMILEVSNFLTLIYFAGFLSKKAWRSNIFEVIGEIQTTMCTWHLFVFSNYVPNYDTQSQMGEVFIILLSTFIMISLVISIYQTFKDLRLIIQKYYQIFLIYLNMFCSKATAPSPAPTLVIPPPPPAQPTILPPVPPKKLDSYQPMMLALKGGKITKILDGQGNPIDRVILNNQDQIIDLQENENDNWKHQSKPLAINRPDWSDIPGFASKMGEISKQPVAFDGKLLVPKEPKDFRQINPILTTQVQSKAKTTPQLTPPEPLQVPEISKVSQPNPQQNMVTLPIQKQAAIQQPFTNVIIKKPETTKKTFFSALLSKVLESDHESSSENEQPIQLQPRPDVRKNTPNQTQIPLDEAYQSEEEREIARDALKAVKDEEKVSNEPKLPVNPFDQFDQKKKIKLTDLANSIIKEEAKIVEQPQPKQVDMGWSEVKHDKWSHTSHATKGKSIAQKYWNKIPEQPKMKFGYVNYDEPEIQNVPQVKQVKRDSTQNMENPFRDQRNEREVPEHVNKMLTFKTPNNQLKNKKYF